MTEEKSLQPTASEEQLSKNETGEHRISLLEQVREGLKGDKRVYLAGEILHPKYGAGWL